MSSIRNLLSGGQMVAYYPALARAVGGIAPALFLQQIAHWEGYSNDGWVYRTQEELEEELAMTPKVQATCRRHLVAGGFMKEQHRAGNRLHYSINWQKVEDEISTDLPSPKKTKASYGSNYVYLMRSPDIGYKIGIATDPEKRRKKLAFELDTRVDIVKAVMRTDAEEVEGKLHSIFNDQSIRTEGGLGTEWFALSNGDVDRTLEEMLRDLPSGETPVGSLSFSQPDKPDLPNGSFSLNKSKDKSKEDPTNVGAAPAATADEFIIFLAEELDTADVPYTRGWKGRHGKQFKELLNKGTPESTLYKACDRIVERWTGEEHRKLTVDQALEDVVNGRPPAHARHLSAVGSIPTPDQYIASIERHPELGRYAGILRQWDFTSPDNPPYKIEVQLGGTQDERWRNLSRLRSLIPISSQGVASGR